MTDNSRLSSNQALEDYFVDLLLEPEPEPEPEPEAAPVPVPQEVEAAIAEVNAEVDGEVTPGEDPRPGRPLPQDAGLLTASPEPKQKLIPVAKPFDFASLDDNAELAARSMPSPVLDNVQRLLNQISRNIPPSSSDIDDAEKRPIDTELADEWQQVMAYEQAHKKALVLPQQQVDETVASHIEAEPVTETTLETQTGEDLPPDLWTQQVQQGSEFQALFFEVNGVTFAVPLTELGGIHQLGDMNHLLGRPAWYLGLMSSRDHSLDVVDTACWAMPDKLDGEAYREQYKYVVVLGDSSWGLACNSLLGTETLSEHSVRWREKAGKRPWLAGMVKEKMCALIHVHELISMLKAGLDVNTKLRQSC
ncbi:chemotaxis protein CheW [Photobacterium lutimaris]|uniref:Chemotaxis protein CheW n=1 Tax=Photobacterium lutimaris TaxID=388278 RepID=A0A2T3INF3_9GAMM|nr:chemotaxis protein CheW [Photobacterium lutimaris]PSU29870.1 chemotaxis protein CheW [Photobacterium lutimaris]TDR75295.1 purine-binding chemotaxis protein CheW [Photobacterium lutimaris]